MWDYLHCYCPLHKALNSWFTGIGTENAVLMERGRHLFLFSFIFSPLLLGIKLSGCFMCVFFLAKLGWRCVCVCVWRCLHLNFSANISFMKLLLSLCRFFCKFLLLLIKACLIFNYYTCNVVLIVFFRKHVCIKK